MHIEKHETLESLPSQAPYSLPPDEPEGGIAASILKRMKSLEEEEDKVAEPPPEFKPISISPIKVTPMEERSSALEKEFNNPKLGV